MADAAQAVEVTAAPQGQPATPAAPAPTSGTQPTDVTQTPATTPATQAAPETIAGSPRPETATPDTKPQNWSDNWRQLMAEGVGGDDKLLKRLDRFTSPAEVLKWAINAEKKISSGEYKKALGKDASPEDLAAWKKENGVPEKPSEYLADLQGLAIGEEDMPGIDNMLEFAASQNMPKEYVQGMVKWYDSWKEQQVVAQQETDVNYQRQSEDALRQEWGGEYRMNQNALKSFALQAFGEELSGDIFESRLPDGSRFGDNPEICKALASVARQLNPAATVVPGAGVNSLQAIGDEIATIKKFMVTNRDDYFKDAAKQKRYQDLISAREKMK